MAVMAGIRGGATPSVCWPSSRPAFSPPPVSVPARSGAGSAVWLFRVWAVLAVWLLGVSPVQAASLGGLSAVPLLAWSEPVSVPLSVFVADGFDGPAGPLHGALAETGQVWSTVGGSFSVTGAGVARSDASKKSWAVVSTGRSDGLEGTLTVSNVSFPSRTGGLLFLASSTASEWMFVVYDPKDGYLYLKVDKGSGEVVRASALVGSGLSTVSYRVRVSGSTVTVSLNGTERFVYGLSPAEAAVFGDNTYWGLASFSRNVMFDSFWVGSW